MSDILYSPLAAEEMSCFVFFLISVCADDITSAAFDELSMFLGFLRVWGIEKAINIDALMSPTEEYFDAIYFQVGIFLQTCMLATLSFLFFLFEMSIEFLSYK